MARFLQATNYQRAKPSSVVSSNVGDNFFLSLRVNMQEGRKCRKKNESWLAGFPGMAVVAQRSIVVIVLLAVPKSASTQSNKNDKADCIAFRSR